MLGTKYSFHAKRKGCWYLWHLFLANNIPTGFNPKMELVSSSLANDQLHSFGKSCCVISSKVFEIDFGTRQLAVAGEKVINSNNIANVK